MSPLSPLRICSHSHNKPWTNPIVSLPVVDLALSEGKRTPPPSSLDVPHLSLCLPSAKMPSFPDAPRGVSPSIYLRPALLGLDPPPPPRLMPSKSPPSSLPLCESPCLKESPVGILPPPKSPSMHRFLPALTTRTAAMTSIPISASTRILILRITRHGIFAAILFCYLSAKGSVS